MEHKIVSFQNKGMTRDVSISKANNEFAFENHNVRIIARDNNTLLSVTNERGNTAIPLEFKGVLLGHAVLNNYLILFTKDVKTDYIYRVEYKSDNTWDSTILFEGNLNFSINNPIETIVNYESEDIQKVYWVDGLNQPRFLNIKTTSSVCSLDTVYTGYDFVTTYKQNLKVEIEHSYQGSGLFSPGSVQYFFTYSNKFLQETNIVNWSSMYYTGLINRGAKNDEQCNDTFKIIIKEYDNSFDYINIYSVQKTQTSRALYKLFSINIKDLSTDKNIVDNNSSKIPLDYSTLLYLGGVQIIAGTMSHKDNTLFLGDLKVEAVNVIPELKEAIDSTIQENGDSTLVSFVKSTGLEGEYPYSINFPKLKGVYPYSHDFNYPSDNILTFKGGELYRFGIVFLTDKGTKSPVYWVGDKINNIYPEINESKKCVNRAVAVFNLNNLPLKAKQLIESNGYTSAILVRAESYFSDRLVQAQGILEPTVFNLYQRVNNLVFTQPSWYSRPLGVDISCKHLDQIESSLSLKGEIQNSYKEVKPYYNSDTLPQDSRIERIFGVFFIEKNLWGVNNECIIKCLLLKEISNQLNRFVNLYNHYITSGSNPHPIDDSIDNIIIALKSVDPYLSYPELINEKALKDSLRVAFNIQQVDDFVLTDIAGITTLTNHTDITIDKPPMMPEFNEEAYKTLKGYDYAIFHTNPLVSEIPDNYPIEYNLSNNSIANTWISNNNAGSNFYIDSTCVTLFSPDISEDNVNIYNNKELNCRIVGASYITGRIFDYKVDVDNKTSIGEVLYNDYSVENITENTTNKTTIPGYYSSTIDGPPSTYLLYPWHKEGSISNSTIPEGKTVKDSSDYLKTKQEVNLLFGGITSYFNNSSFIKYNKINTYSSGIEGSVLTIIGDEQESYYSNVDLVLSLGLNILGDPNKFPVVKLKSRGLNVDVKYLNDSDLYPNKSSDLDNIKEELLSKEIVKMKYKTNPHLVFKLPKTLNIANTLPEFGEKLAVKETRLDVIYPWNNEKVEYNTPIITTIPKYSNYPSVFIGELYKERDGSEYGGKEEAALESNVFLPISKITKLSDNKIVGSIGDTYFQRYDCVRTLPLTDTDTNQNTSITSFMVETRNNIAGRSDIRRGWTSMVGISNENFNLMNTSYNTLPDSPTFSVLDNKFSLQEFPSQITWSKPKLATEETDTWTNITLASTLDLDGDKGPVRAIRRFQNSLIAFQDKGISEILFNSRTQLSTQQGVPIEIGNSGRVEGKRYITDKAGCINKWSIIETKSGIYFIDNITSSISLFNGNVNSLSDTKGFKAWIGKNNSTNIWNPKDFNNFISYWDRLNDDIYFINKDIALCYNELLQQFTSFFDYNEVPMMVNVEDKFLSFKGGKLWIQNEGEYNKLFNEYKPFSIKYKVTPDPYGDKIFNNIEYRADMTTSEDILTDNTFDILKVHNEYQNADLELSFAKNGTSPLKKKFRIWRANIPRDSNIGPDNPYGLNRIRNPWIYLELVKNNNLDNNEKIEFHDLSVRYFE